MCASCGCGMVNEDHGDARHITMDRLREAGRASNLSVEDVVNNLQQSAQQEAEGQQPERTGVSRAS